MADYIQFTEGAPCLLGLGIVCQHDSEEGLGRLANVLANGGAPNLESLSLEHANGEALKDLGRIYRAGGSSKLTSIELEWATFDGETMGAFMNGVLASGQRGAALESFDLRSPNEVDQEDEEENEHAEDGLDASRAFIAALKKGTFPKLQRLEVYENPGILGVEEIIGELVDALKNGAPCALTLRKLLLESVDEENRQALKELFPRADLRLR